MYDEPYRWVQAIGNRRQYLDEQFKQGSPVVAVSYADGILLLTVSRGTPKLYEIYDRIGLGGMGHPADLEKLRFSLLELAHMEGFNRSPSDVTGSRLVKYGLAPVIKQAFEEVYKAPFIVKILLAELGTKPGRDGFLTINYDGAFEETTSCAIIAATPDVQAQMTECVKREAALASTSLAQALEVSLRAWTVGSLAQRVEETEDPKEELKTEKRADVARQPEPAAVQAHLREVMGERTIECAVLERNASGSSKYRVLKANEVTNLMPKSLTPSD